MKSGRSHLLERERTGADPGVCLLTLPVMESAVLMSPVNVLDRAAPVWRGRGGFNEEARGGV